MKKNTKRQLVSLILAIVISTPLTSCKSSSSMDEPSTWQQSETSSDAASSIIQGSQSIAKDKYEEQIKYYIDLTESLQNELLILKEEKYIGECEYQLQIAVLEQTVRDLKDSISTSSPSNSSQNSQIALKSEFQYTEANGQITVTGYSGTATNAIIPSEIDGKPVTSIGESAFKGSAIISLNLPSSVTSIDWFAFLDCTKLQRITIPSSVISIGYEAFKNCPSSLTIVCSAGSYAEGFAQSWGIRFVTE